MAVNPVHTASWYIVRTTARIYRIPRSLYGAWETVGGLSSPSKMPGTSYNLPGGYDCPLGKKLGCASICYAGKGNYLFPDVRATLARRLEAVVSDLPAWESAMADILTWYASNAPTAQRFHRWHDSGDVQSPGHLAAIVRIARAVPAMRFWLPTRAYGWVVSLGSDIPDNLTIRLSSPKMDTRLPGNLPTSMIHKGEPPANVYPCPAPTQGGKCAECRACWDRTAPTVSYHLH